MIKPPDFPANALVIFTTLIKNTYIIEPAAGRIRNTGIAQLHQFLHQLVPGTFLCTQKNRPHQQPASKTLLHL
jgi:hypothetical protein